MSQSGAPCAPAPLTPLRRWRERREHESWSPSRWREKCEAAGVRTALFADPAASAEPAQAMAAESKPGGAVRREGSPLSRWREKKGRDRAEWSKSHDADVPAESGVSPAETRRAESLQDQSAHIHEAQDAHADAEQGYDAHRGCETPLMLLSLPQVWSAFSGQEV